MKYTKEVLEPLVKESLSVAEVLKKLGLRNPNGGTHAYISKAIKRSDLDTSHFLGKARNRGLEHKGGSEKLSWESILVIDRFQKGRKEDVARLRRSMIESGINHMCGTCSVGLKWNNDVLVLQISHKNGNSLDNRKENLWFQCPNCHSQTSDFAGRGSGKNALMAEQQTRSI